jgi:DNA helicase HerA-like ATPase
MMDDEVDLDEWFGASPAQRGIAPAERLGIVMAGSLSKGLDVKLDGRRVIEGLAVGRYVVIHGQGHKFFCMITDVALDNTNPLVEKTPPDMSNPTLQAIHRGTTVFGRVHVAPLLVVEGETPRPVKTVPSHFAEVFDATEEDVNQVFGVDDQDHFWVGAPLDMEKARVHLDLPRLVERSVGVFGKSGTGKSFLTRILLAGVIKRQSAVNLIFDMHNDYGWEIRTERGERVKGLKQLFGRQVAIFTLDDESSRRRGVRPDYVVTLGYDEIEPEDIAMLQQTLDLRDPMVDAAYILRRKWGRGWITKLLQADAEEIEMILGITSIHPGSLTALSRRLERFSRFGFLKEKTTGDSVQRILEFLAAGRSVVLEFGRYGNALEAYILVANYLTRRIHQQYVQRMERALGDRSQEPPQLLITIEEAHKFLDPQIARQTIFGVIARELRKYNVTLLVVDQRPSGIDEEVMSQIGTRVTALLDNERDISAVLTGVSGAGGLREVLSRLDTQQQAIIMGHAVPMPVVVQVRPYDTEFYAAEGTPEGDLLGEAAAHASQSLYGDEDSDELA